MTDTVFKKVDYQLGNLIGSIGLGEIGLPDIQRPFVWGTAKVRDLFDSMYRGYPVGHLLFWESGAEEGAKQIGVDAKQLVPKLLIVDGQQRLTSLYAVMRQREVIGTDYSPHRIRIAFRPRDELFVVTDAAVVNDPTFLPDVGEIWATDTYTAIRRFLARLSETPAWQEGDDERIPAALLRLAKLDAYPFTALVLGSEVKEEQVAEVFVRINSQGKQLNQADFILTLMSVWWDEGRAQLERWSRDAHTPGDAAWNPFVALEPDHLVRVGIAVGFRRGRLEDAYSVLRGRDPTSGEISADARATQFARLSEAQAKVLDKDTWKEFLQALTRAGHRSSATISSNLAIVYCYALYLIGKHDFGVPRKQLRDIIARWFFMSSLTGRYSFSPETRIAADLASLPEARDSSAFVQQLDKVIAQQLTNDYWEIALPNELARSGARSPSLFAYLASLSILGSQVLFSKMKVVELADPVLGGGKAKIQRHHLFPKKYLKEIGITETKQINQIANLTPLEWHDNLGIAATDPSVYWPAYLEAMQEPPDGMAPFSEVEIEQMILDHGLPRDWPSMEYHEFLAERRKQMAKVVKRAFDTLVGGELVEMPGWPPSPAAVEHLLQGGETAGLELKSSLRADTLGKGIPPQVLEKVVARTVAGFMNTHGGTLIIGVRDDGTPVGLDKDITTLPRKDLDSFQQALVQVVAKYLGADVAAMLRICITRIGVDSRQVAVVEAPAAAAPVYLRDGKTKEFHVRAGATTRLLDVEETTTYVGQHWKHGFAAFPALTPEG